VHHVGNNTNVKMAAPEMLRPPNQARPVQRLPLSKVVQLQDAVQMMPLLGHTHLVVAPALRLVTVRQQHLHIFFRLTTCLPPRHLQYVLADHLKIYS